MISSNIKLFYFQGTTDSNISEEDMSPPPLPAKHKDTLIVNENMSFLHARCPSIGGKCTYQIEMTETFSMQIDNNVPPSPPPKPPKIKQPSLNR